MVVIQGILTIFIEFFLMTLASLSVLVVLLIVSYFARDTIRGVVNKVWSMVHEESYLEHKRREDAHRKFEEKSE